MDRREYEDENCNLGSGRKHRRQKDQPGNRVATLPPQCGHARTKGRLGDLTLYFEGEKGVDIGDDEKDGRGDRQGEGDLDSLALTPEQGATTANTDRRTAVRNHWLLDNRITFMTTDQRHPIPRFGHAYCSSHRSQSLSRSSFDSRVVGTQ